MEKDFVFETRRDANKLTYIRVKESELTQPQKELLFCELVAAWNTAPKEVQIRFMKELSDGIRHNYSLKLWEDFDFRSMIKDLQ